MLISKWQLAERMEEALAEDDTLSRLTGILCVWFHSWVDEQGVVSNVVALPVLTICNGYDGGSGLQMDLVAATLDPDVFTVHQNVDCMIAITEGSNCPDGEIPAVDALRPYARSMEGTKFASLPALLPLDKEVAVQVMDYLVTQYDIPKPKDRSHLRVVK